MTFKTSDKRTDNMTTEGISQEVNPVVNVVAESNVWSDDKNDNVANEEDNSAEDSDRDDNDSIDSIVERLAGECDYVEFVQLVDFIGVLKSESSPTSIAPPICQCESVDSDNELDILMEEGEMEKDSGDDESSIGSFASFIGYLADEKDNQEGNYNGSNKNIDAEYDECLGVINSPSSDTHIVNFLRDGWFNLIKGMFSGTPKKKEVTEEALWSIIIMGPPAAAVKEERPSGSWYSFWTWLGPTITPATSPNSRPSNRHASNEGTKEQSEEDTIYSASSFEENHIV